MSGGNELDETPGSEISVAVEGKALSGAIDTNEETLVPVKTLVQELKWKVPYANETHAVFDAGGDSTPMYLTYSFLDESIQVDEDEAEEEIIKRSTRAATCSPTRSPKRWTCRLCSMRRRVRPGDWREKPKRAGSAAGETEAQAGCRAPRGYPGEDRRYPSR